MSKPEIKFAADRMLGRLARWLRLLGYDTVYNPQLSLEDLIKCSILEGRFLLTRNRRYNRYPKDLALFLIDTEKVPKQVEMILKKFALDTKSNLFSRCCLCNCKVEKLAKDKVKGKVPPKVFKYFDKFFCCPNCQRIYWMGSHHERFIKKLKQILRKVKKSRKSM